MAQLLQLRYGGRPVVAAVSGVAKVVVVATACHRQKNIIFTILACELTAFDSVLNETFIVTEL